MMKTKFYALLFFLTVAMSGCDNEYDDTGIRTQIAEVTDQVKALQTLTEALQNRDYILSVVPTTVEGVPGYLITFAQAEPVTILCGTSVIAAVDTSHGDYVVFTLADGTTTITLPRSNAVTIGLDGYDVLYCTASSLDIPLLFPSTLKSGDYTSIAATVTNDNGTGTDIQTRASAGTNGVWKVDITQPAFGDDGMIIPNSSKVTLTPPKHVKLSDTAILKVTLVDKKGMETTVTRPIKYSTVAAVTSTAGNLSSVATDAEMTALAIKGSVDATDLAYIRNTLTKLEVLDLSMTDMVTLPGWGLGFHPDDGYQPNTTLKEVMLPASLVTIGKSAFLNCRALDYVDTGNAETITEYAFEGCSNLREVILSEKLKTVGNCAFRNCVSLSLIDIPGSVETLGRWVFENCGNLQSVVLHEGVQSLSGKASEKTAGARMKKYELDASATNDGKLQSNDIVLFRYADVLLMKSEAKVRNGGNGDAELTEVRERAGATLDVTATLETLLEERLREFAWEGLRRQDLVRFGKFTRAYTDRPQLPKEDTGYTTVFPIHEDVLSLNGKLTQNYGY